MSIFVGILTHNPRSLGRMSLLIDTISSVMAAFPESQILLFDNWSTDDSLDYIVALAQDRTGVTYGTHVPQDGNHTPGRGVDLMIRRLMIKFGLSTGGRGHIFVCSDDDMRWKRDAADKIRAFWQEPPTNVKLLGGLLEPVWHWNKPRFAIESGGVRALVRDSTPAAAWSFPAAFAMQHILPLEPTWKFDTALCRKLKREGGLVAQMDLADHMGEGLSSQNNDAKRSAVPLDRQKWGV